MKRAVPLYAAIFLLSGLLLHEFAGKSDLEKRQARAVALLTDRYKKTQLSEGPALRRIGAKGSEIRVRVGFPEDLSNSLRRMAPKRRRAFLASYCPAPFENVWDILGRGGSIVIVAEASSGTPFGETVCLN